MFHFRILSLTTTAIILVVGDVSQISGDLSSAGPDVSDGPCQFPGADELAVNTNVVQLYSPLKKYYIPRASKSFYRTLYEIVNGGNSASSEEQVSSLEPRVQFLTFRIIRKFGNLEITFDDNPSVWYGYRCLPSTLRTVTSRKPLVPLLNVTCTLVGGSEGVASEGQVGQVYFSSIWSDGTATGIWGCFNGRQNYHIISTQQQLTREQIDANDALLKLRGFNVTNFVNVKHSS